MSVPSEASALIERAKKGDRGAFEALMRSHYDGNYLIAF
jgi:hypothetical protein